MKLPERAVAYVSGVALILVLSVWFYRPILREGLFADDFVATAILDGTFAAQRSPLDLFDFARGTPEDVRALRRLGSLPWWAPDDYRIAFLRPLSSALWLVDRALFGTAYGAYHAHSLLVFCVLVSCVSWLYRRLFSAKIALLATLIFAVDDSHHFPVVWLSNRGGIYALLLGSLALLAHARFRESGGRVWAVVSALAVSCAVLFGEWALPMVSYLVAYELCVASGPLRARALALLPSLVPSLSFVVARSWLHYGARGSGAYIDPGVDPLRFLGSVLQRVPMFVADMVWNVPSEWWDHGSPWRDRLLQLWIIPPELWVKLPSWQTVQIGLGLLGVLALYGGYRFCRARLSEREHKNVLFLAVGALGALTPVVGSFPSTRLTIAAFLGVCPIFALVLRECALRLRALPGSALGLRRALPLVAAVAGLVHLQLLAPLSAQIQPQVDHYATTREWVAAADLDPTRVAQQRVFMLAGAEFTTTFFFAYIWSHVAAGARPLPRSYYPITACPCAHFAERTAPNELVLHALGGAYLGSGDETMFHSPRRVFREGETIELPELRVRVEQVSEGVPGVLRLQFARPLEDPSYVFLTAAPHGIVRAELPALGHRLLIPRAAAPSWINLERHRDFLRSGGAPELLSYTPTPGFVAYAP